MLPHKLVFVDIETTGASLRNDSVIEIGILRVEDGKIVSSFNSLINPERPVSQDILTLTGITRDQLESAPVFDDLQRQILELMDDCVFVAHNVRFDYGFLQTEFRRREKSWSAKQLCTVRLSRLLYPQHTHHNLDIVIQRHQIPCPNRHRAFDDAKVLWDFYQLVQAEFGTERIAEIVDQAMRRPSLPIHLASKQLDDLPEGPGVYIFYGLNDLPLYIGKSVNLKDRVMSHFGQSHRDSLELKISQQVERIETIETAGELGALLLEAQLIKQLQPLYNRKLRIKHQMTVIHKVEHPDNYTQIKIETAEQLEADQVETIMGVFRSKKQVKTFLETLVDKHQLCPRLLQLETGKGACFDYRLGKCKGACVGKEKPSFYNLRFLEAFTKYKFQSWPFQQPIVVYEENPQTGKHQSYMVNKWCLLDPEKGLSQFDVDIYQILKKFLLSVKGRPRFSYYFPD